MDSANGRILLRCLRLIGSGSGFERLLIAAETLSYRTLESMRVGLSSDNRLFLVSLAISERPSPEADAISRSLTSKNRPLADSISGHSELRENS
jgi:hypothetical protein